MNMRISHRVSLFLSLIVLLLIAGGCATKKAGPKNYMVFPPPPDEARIQYLWSYGSETELGGRGAFSDFVVGSEKIYRPIIKPYGVAVKNGRIYVCDTQAGNISIADLKTRRMRYVKPVGQAAMKVPVNVAVDSKGAVYVTDTGREQLLIYDQKGNLLHALGQKDEMKPCGLALTEDRIFLTDLKNSCVRVYNKETRELIRTFPPKTEPENVRLFQPTNLAVDSSGRVCVSDSGGFAIKIFDQEGKHLQTVGELGVSPGRFALPKGIGADRDGRFYVIDAAAPVVQAFDKEGKLLMFFGHPDSSGPAGLYLPAALQVDYDNVDFFQKYVAPGYRLEYLILLTNQVGPQKVSVFGFIKKIEP